jgi:hypothetical protein
MRAKAIVSAGVLMLASLGAVASQATSDDGESKELEVFHLTAKADQQHFIDEAPAGFSQGDSFIFANSLYSRGHKVGEDGGACTVVRAASGGTTFQCLGTNTLPGGQLTAQGLTTADATREVLAITGGTGRYKTARGEVRITEVSDTELALTFRIVR